MLLQSTKLQLTKVNTIYIKKINIVMKKLKTVEGSVFALFLCRINSVNRESLCQQDFVEGVSDGR